MENKCPKCGAKLSVFYLKPECPKCGCNIMNYNMEERLEADADKADGSAVTDEQKAAVKAEAEWAKAEKLLAKFKKKADKEEPKDENPA